VVSCIKGQNGSIARGFLLKELRLKRGRTYVEDAMEVEGVGETAFDLLQLPDSLGVVLGGDDVVRSGEQTQSVERAQFGVVTNLNVLNIQH
jgi:hypothetical protein